MLQNYLARPAGRREETSPRPLLPEGRGSRGETLHDLCHRARGGNVVPNGPTKASPPLGGTAPFGGGFRDGCGGRGERHVVGPRSRSGWGTGGGVVGRGSPG